MLAKARALHRRRIGALLRLAQRAAVVDAALALEPLGITIAQGELLAGIAAAPGSDQRAIGAALGIDRSSITALVDAAERQGWVVRRAHSDRRRKLLALTRTGEDMLARALPLFASAARTTLTDEVADLPYLLGRLADAHGIVETAPPALAALPSFLLRRCAQTAAAMFAEAAGANALPGLDYSILLLLDARLAESQSDLLATIATHRSSTLPALRRLEAAGMVVRNGSVEDRRRRDLAATRAGRTRLKALAAPIATYEQAFLAPLSSGENARLRESLSRLAERFDETV